MGSPRGSTKKNRGQGLTKNWYGTFSHIRKAKRTGLSSLILPEGGDAAQGLAHRGGPGFSSLVLPEVGA